MDNQAICTAYEAAAAWDLSRGDSGNFDGLILVVDLDQGSAGLCRCAPGQPPVQTWAHSGSLSGSFFRDAVWTLLPGCSSPEGERLLRESLTGMIGSRAQKNFIRFERSEDLQLPDVVLDGQVYQPTCAGLAEVFGRSHEQPLRQMLGEAKAELDRQLGDGSWRVLPTGELAGLYMAEYLVRETFLKKPMLPDDRLRLCTGREDPARIAEQGYQLYRQNYSREKTIGKHLQLQVLRRTAGGTASELLTLARGDSTYSELRQVRYVGPICIADGEPLTLYADSDRHRLSVPAGGLIPAGALGCVEVGIGAEDEALYLSVRNQSGGTARLALGNIV